MKFTVGSNNDDDDEDDDDDDDNDSNENSTTKHWLIMSENRRSARVSCILVHVFAVLCKAIRWHDQI